MLQHPQNPVIGPLANLRKEWQAAAGNSSLLHTEGNVGLILADLVKGLDLSADLQAEILGDDLYRELQELFGAANTN
jgi:hypothetical protein